MKGKVHTILNQAIKANLMMSRAIKAPATTTARTGITVDRTIVCDDPGGEVTDVCGSVDRITTCDDLDGDVCVPVDINRTICHIL